MPVVFDLRGEQQMDVFTGWTHILVRRDGLNVLMDLFLTNTDLTIH